MLSLLGGTLHLLIGRCGVRAAAQQAGLLCNGPAQLEHCAQADDYHCAAQHVLLDGL